MNSVAAAYCEANPNDSFCSCYNVLNDKCDPTSKTGPAGCSDTGSYVDLRNATPDDFKSVWDGQRKCGSVCAGANKYIPAGVIKRGVKQQSKFVNKTLMWVV